VFALISRLAVATDFIVVISFFRKPFSSKFVEVCRLSVTWKQCLKVRWMDKIQMGPIPPVFIKFRRIQ
jgi:hypothetical protein